jgi:hypothetical protein
LLLCRFAAQQPFDVVGRRRNAVLCVCLPSFG